MAKTPAQQYVQAAGGNPTANDLIQGANAGDAIPTGNTSAEIGAGDLFPQGYVAPLHNSTPGDAGFAWGPAFGAMDTAPVTGLGTRPNANPYVEGDQFKMMNRPAAEIKEMQHALVSAGLLDGTHVHWGVWDIDSANAWRTVLAQANAYGASGNDMLKALVTNAPASIKGQKAPLQLANPADIENQVSSLGEGNTATAMLGHNLPAGETAAFVKWYQGQEAAARNAYNNLDLTTQTAYTDKPSLDAAAQAYIKAHNLDQVIAYGTASRALEFQNMLAAL